MRAATRVGGALLASLGLGLALESQGWISLLAGLMGVGLWLFLGLSARRHRGALGLSFLIGALGFGFGFRWLVGSLGDVGHVPMPLAWTATLCLGAYVGVLWGLAIVVARLFGRTFVMQASLATLLIIAMESLRGFGFLAFDWGAPGYWSVNTPLSALVQWGGMPLLNGVLLWAGWSVACLIGSRTRKVGMLGVLSVALLSFVLSLVGPGRAWAPWGSERVSSVGVLEERMPEHAQVVLGLQPDQSVLMNASDEVNSARLVQTYEVLEMFLLTPTGALLRHSETPKLWVVPEGVTNVVHGLGRWDDMLDRWGEAMQKAAPAASVAVTTFHWEEGRVTNAMLYRDGDAWQVVEKKRYLVPFGEAIPSWAETLVEAWLGITMKGFMKGEDEQRVTTWGALKLGFMICYETLSESLVRDTANTGALPDLWVVSSNLAWFKPSIYPQHLAQAQLRAMESNRPLLLVANTGPTALLDATGHVLTALPAGRGVLPVWVKASTSAMPLGVRLYPWMWALWGLILVGVLGLNRRVRGREVLSAHIKRHA